MHSGSQHEQNQESPSAKIHIFKLFSEQNAASVGQNRADKSYTDTGAGLKHTAVIIRTEPAGRGFCSSTNKKDLSGTKEREERALKITDSHWGILSGPDVTKEICSVIKEELNFNIDTQPNTRFHFMTGWSNNNFILKRLFVQFKNSAWHPERVSPPHHQNWSLDPRYGRQQKRFSHVFGFSGSGKFQLSDRISHLSNSYSKQVDSSLSPADCSCH